MFKPKFVMFLIIAFLFLICPSCVADETEEPWTGVDVSIVGKHAKRFGRPPRDPYINTDKGDLLLCLFTLGGTIGGFIIGYNWHRLMKSRLKGEKAKRRKGEEVF